MQVTLKSNALEIEDRHSSEEERNTLPYKMWYESVLEMIAEGSTFYVHTGSLSVDSFTVFYGGISSIEIPEYMVESVIDDERVGNCLRVTIKENALKLNDELLPESVLISDDYISWRDRFNKLLLSGYEHEVMFRFDEMTYVLGIDGNPLRVHENLISTYVMRD